LEYIEIVTRTIESTGALDYTSRLAEREAEQAIASLAPLADSSAKDALVGLARFAINRHS
jgi:octaprenyl-diphosphate synthase